MKNGKLLLIGAIVSILLIVCVGILFLLPDEKNDKPQNKVEENKEVLDNDKTKLDKDVEEALNYIYVYEWRGFGLDLRYENDDYKKDNESYGMFADYKVDNSNLSLYGKYSLIVQLLDRDGYFDEVEYYKYKEEDNYEDLILATEEDLKDYDKSGFNQCDSDVIVRKYPKINKSLISRYAKNIFGIDNIEILSFSYYCISCDLVNGEYNCRNYTGGTGSSNASWEYKYVDYEKNNDEMYIYHKAFWGFNDYLENGNENYVIFNTDNNEKDDLKDYVKNDKLIAVVNDFQYDNIDKLLDKYGVTFKSVFKKNSDGEYRWVSTEPIK